MDTKIPIIFGRPFLETGWAFVDVESGEFIFWVNEHKFTFNIGMLMKQQNYIHLVFAFDVNNKPMSSMSYSIVHEWNSWSSSS